MSGVVQSGTITPGHVVVWAGNGIIADGGTVAPSATQGLSVIQTGTVTPGHVVTWASSGIVQDGGTSPPAPSPSGPPVEQSGVVTPGDLVVWVTTGVVADGGGGAGTVFGPNGATNGNLAAFNGTTGRILEDSGVTISAAMLPVVGASTTVLGGALLGAVGGVYSVLAYSADPSGATDSAAAIANTLSAAPAGGCVFFPPGKYLINSAVNITKAVTILALPNTVTILLGTQNMNGLVVGDGTITTRNATFNTSIMNINFNPAPGVGAFGSGACVYLNYVSNGEVSGCTFYGYNGAATALYDGIVLSQVQEYKLLSNVFSYMGDTGISMTGGATVTTNTSDLRIDYDEFTNCQNGGIVVGAGCGGMTINFPIMYENSGTAIYISSPSNGEGGGINIFINQPDLELDNGTDGIYIEAAQGVQVVGGWIGGKGSEIAILASPASTSSNHVFADVQIDQALVTINAPQVNVVGCQITGDNATQTVGVNVEADALGTTISGCNIAQWTEYGIQVTGNPANVLIDGCNFRSIGTLEVAGIGSTNAKISGCQNDQSGALTAATTLVLRPGRNFYTVTGATDIENMGVLGAESQVTILAGTGGITWTTGGNIVLGSGISSSQAAGATRTFVMDGANTIWYQIGGTG